MNALTEACVKSQLKIQSMLEGEEGATMVEYALMLALIAVVCLTAVTAVGSNANLKFNSIVTSLGG